MHICNAITSPFDSILLGGKSQRYALMIPMLTLIVTHHSFLTNWMLFPVGYKAKILYLALI